MAYLERAFAAVEPTRPIVDLGCGHGRHAAPLSRGRRVVGLDRDSYSLRHRLPQVSAVRGDLLQMPFRTQSMAGAYAWYSTLFTFDDAQQVPLFREIARILQPGALLVLHTVPYERIAAQPEASFHQTLPDGTLLTERSRFDPETGRDCATRTLAYPDGRVLSASFFIRYYPLSQLSELLGAAGLSVRWAHGGLDGEPLSLEASELIIGAVRNDA